MKRMLDDLAAQGGFASFEEGNEPYDNRDVERATEAGLLRVRLVTGNSLDVHYELTDKAREMYGLPPTFETTIIVWMHNRIRWLWSSPNEDGTHRLSSGKVGFWFGIAATLTALAAIGWIDLLPLRNRME